MTGGFAVYLQRVGLLRLLLEQQWINNLGNLLYCVT